MANMSPDVEKLLVDFVTHANEEILGEHSTKNLHLKVDGLSKAVQTVAEGLSAHVQECTRHREAENIRERSTHERLVSLEAGGAKTLAPPSLPPMRSEADSSHDLHATADKITVAALEGIRDPHKTPEETIANVVKQIEEESRIKRRLAELEAAEQARVEDARRAKEEKQRLQSERRKFWANIAVAAVGGGGVIASAVEGLRGLFHH
jgi:hypothetical protein